jgi:hypothetical protein
MTLAPECGDESGTDTRRNCNLYVLQYLRAAAEAGTLPAYSFLQPNWTDETYAKVKRSVDSMREFVGYRMAQEERAAKTEW